jgi:regulator of replication initiation timing
MNNLEMTIKRLSDNPDISTNVYYMSLIAEIKRLRNENEDLRQSLKWYVENDDTNEGGKWEESNAPWLEGKRRAMRALGMEE